MASKTQKRFSSGAAWQSIAGPIHAAPTELKKVFFLPPSYPKNMSFLTELLLANLRVKYPS